MYFILGYPNSLTNRIYGKLRAKGYSVAFLDPRSFPTDLRFQYTTDPPTQGWIDSEALLRPVALEDIEGIFWWFYPGIGESEAGSYFEAETALLNLFHQLDCPWVNPPTAVFQHRFKGAQLNLVQALGVMMPDTLIGNDPELVCDFFVRHQGQVIMKNITESGVPQKLTAEWVQNLSNGAFDIAPAIFQPFIAGVDVRVHVVGEEIFASEVHSSEWVSKVTLETPVPITLPQALQEDCFAITQALGMVWTGIDFRKTPDGEFYFLEANPSPQYPLFEDRNDFPISEALVNCLLQKRKPSGISAQHSRKVWI